MKKLNIGLLPKIIIAIVLGVVLGFFLPTWSVRIFTTFNGIFSQFLNFFVPLIILGFVAPAIADLDSSAGKLLVLTVIIAYVSTVISGMLSYVTSSLVLPNFIFRDTSFTEAAASNALDPFFELKIPPMLDVLSAIVLAFALGIGTSVIKGHTLKHFLFDFRGVIEMVVAKAIVPLLPLYIFGVFLKMSAAGTVMTLLTVFIKVIAMVVVMHFCWLILLFCFTGGITKRNPLALLGTMIPSWMTALGTQSSVATIPVNLKQVRKLGVSDNVADFVVPLCATIHLSGSILQITAFSVALMIIQGMPHDFGTFAAFVMILGITLVAAPGVPGGAIMASLGVLGSILGFSAGDQALMISLYVAVDSFGTATNVTGDGAVALLVDAFDKRERRRKVAAASSGKATE